MMSDLFDCFLPHAFQFITHTTLHNVRSLKASSNNKESTNQISNIFSKQGIFISTYKDGRTNQNPESCNGGFFPFVISGVPSKITFCTGNKFMGWAAERKSEMPVDLTGASVRSTPAVSKGLSQSILQDATKCGTSVHSMQIISEPELRHRKRGRVDDNVKDKDWVISLGSLSSLGWLANPRLYGQLSAKLRDILLYLYLRRLKKLTEWLLLLNKNF
jgi:hypothetical protein